MSLFAVLLIPCLAHSAESEIAVVKSTSFATEILTVVPAVGKITDENRYAGSISGKSIVIKELATGKVLLKEELTYNILSFAISMGGEWLALSGQGGGQLMHIPTNKVVVSLPSYARDMKFSPDGTRLAVSKGSSGAIIVDCRTGRNLGQFQGGDVRLGPVVGSVTFSPDGEKLFALVDNGDIH